MMKKFVFAALVALMLLPLTGSAGQVNSKNNVDFYGYIKLDAVYQSGYGIMDNFLVQAAPANLCALGPCNGNGEQRNRETDSFSMTARQSRFGFLITGPESDSGITTRGRLEMDFYGSAPARAVGQDPEENKGLLMLRRAYVEIMGENWSILAGNEWMVVSPIFPNVNNYPYGADVGNLGYRTPQIRFTMYGMEKALALQIAATNKLGDVDTLDIDTGRMYGGPTWEAGLTYNGPFMLALTGHYGFEEIQSTRSNALGVPTFGYYGAQVESWSANASVKIPLGDMFAISGEWYTGANLDGWYTGGVGQGFVMTEDGDREALEDTGFWAELMIKPADALKFYVGMGMDDPNDDQLENGVIEPGYIDGDPTTPGYQPKTGNAGVTKNSMYYANVWYNVNASTMVSGEWMQMITEYDLADGEAGNPELHNGMVNRYTLSFWYIF